MTICLVIHKRMDKTDERKARPGRITDRGMATIGIPTIDAIGGEAHATHRVSTGSKLYAANWHLEDVGSARVVKHVRPFEKTRKRLAVLAVADEAQACGRPRHVCDTAQVATSAAQRNLCGHVRGIDHNHKYS